MFKLSWFIDNFTAFIEVRDQTISISIINYLYNEEYPASWKSNFDEKNTEDTLISFSWNISSIVLHTKFCSNYHYFQRCFVLLKWSQNGCMILEIAKVHKTYNNNPFRTKQSWTRWRWLAHLEA
jgi:hypothetical protein